MFLLVILEKVPYIEPPAGILLHEEELIRNDLVFRLRTLIGIPWYLACDLLFSFLRWKCIDREGGGTVPVLYNFAILWNIYETDYYGDGSC